MLLLEIWVNSFRGAWNSKTPAHWNLDWTFLPENKKERISGKEGRWKENRSKKLFSFPYSNCDYHTLTMTLDKFLKLILTTLKVINGRVVNASKRIYSIPKPQFLHLICSRSHLDLELEPAAESSSWTLKPTHYTVSLIWGTFNHPAGTCI